DVCSSDLQRRARAGQRLAERTGREVLAGRKLVHPDPFDEVRLGVHQGDLRVAAQSPGEPTCCDGAGIPGAEDDDAVLHGSLNSSAGWVSSLLNKAPARSLTPPGCEMAHHTLVSGSPCSIDAHCRLTRDSLSGLTWVRTAEMPASALSRTMTPTTFPEETASTAGLPLAIEP